MAGKTGKPLTPPKGADREARLKAALKANMARRKAQARARAARSASVDGGDGTTESKG